MSYGTLSKNPINHYNKIYYTIGRTTFEPIHVFKTNPNSESIAPAVCLTDSKKHLSEMNPPTAVIGNCFICICASCQFSRKKMRQILAPKRPSSP